MVDVLTREVNEICRNLRVVDLDIRISQRHIVDEACRSILNIPLSSFLRLASLLAGIVQSQAVCCALSADILEPRWAGEFMLPGFLSGKGSGWELRGRWKGVGVVCESTEMLVIFIALFDRQSD